MGPVPPIIPSNQNINVKFLGILVAVLLVIGLSLGAYLYTQKLANTPFIPFLAPTPASDPLVAGTPPDTTPENFFTCEVQKEGNTLVESVINSEATQTKAINYSGMVWDYEFDSSSDTAKFTLRSKEGNQDFQFTMKDETNLVFDSNLQSIKLSEIKTGDTILLSYNCDFRNEQPSPSLVRISRLASGSN